MKSNKLQFEFIIAFLFVFFILPQNSLAQQTSLSISPSLVEIIVKPGKTLNIPYRITNKGDPIILLTKVLPFEPRDNLGHIKIKHSSENPFNFTIENKDISLNQPFFMKSKETRDLNLQIQVPAKTPLKDYYYTFLAETDIQSPKDEDLILQAKTSIGSNILITVSEENNTDVNGKIIFFDLLPAYKIKLFGKLIKIVDSSNQLSVVLIVENKGKNLLKPKGKISLLDSFGKKTDYNIFPKNVLAYSQRLLNVSSQKTDKPYSLLISNFLIGRYNLSTQISFGGNSENVYESTSFIALPIKNMITLFIVSIIAVLVIKYVRKFRRK